MKNNLCYIVIANYNSYNETINCIDSILKSKYMLYKIIIVDDCSIDNSYDLPISFVDLPQQNMNSNPTPLSN